MATIEEFQRELEKTNTSDFRIIKYSNDKDGTLVIAGSFDFCYYHDCELHLFEVSYISCPTTFCDAKFRLATEEEKNSIKSKLLDGFHDQIICITLGEDIDPNPTKHFIVAREIEFNFDLVFYYKKENLQPNQRIAEWVK